MNDEFSIIGCGARTPLGFDRRSSAAAVRAGISAIAEHPSLVDRFGEPMNVARDAALDPDLAGLERLLALAIPAASEALGRHKMSPPLLADKTRILEDGSREFHVVSVPGCFASQVLTGRKHKRNSVTRIA